MLVPKITNYVFKSLSKQVEVWLYLPYGFIPDVKGNSHQNYFRSSKQISDNAFPVILS